ncbi:MAG: SDR family NAD(P)-dependent oxidoreductase, partial [Sinimarinibacterium sp.]
MTATLRYDGKVVIITGAGNGLGRAHALLFGSRGARVIVNDLGGDTRGGGRSTTAADEVIAQIRALGGEAVASHDSVEDGARIVQCARDHFGTVDVVVNNAGILRDVSFHKMTAEDWEWVQRVHVAGTFRVTHAAWPILREKGYGRIVMTTSAAGLYGNFGQANYAAAKLAVVGLASTLAIEGRKSNVRVNTIAPIAGSRLTQTVLPPELVEALKPEAVSPLVGWLCHHRCEETGSVFEVGAGYIGKLRWSRSRGAAFPPGQAFGPEDVAARWSRINDFTDAEHPANVAESMAPLIRNLKSPPRGGNALLDVDAAYADTLEVESRYDERDLALYALGVGAARDPLDASELKFVYEQHPDFQALPSYAVIPALGAFLDRQRQGGTLKGLNYGIERVLHGEQMTELLQPLPPRATLRHVFRL